MFLEIQDAFKDLLCEDIYIIEYFYIQLLLEPIPVKTFIAETQPIIEIEVKPEKQKTKTPKPVDVVIHSFTYKYQIKESGKLTDLWDNLKKNHFIAKNTNLTNFKKVFSGKEITTPVVWIGKISELNYFIKLIHNLNKSVVDLKQRHWEITCKCFVQSDGKTPFDRAKLKDQKKPKLTATQLESAANLL